MKRTHLTAWVGILCLLPAVAFAKQNRVLNGSNEFGDGPGGIDPQIADGWTEFGENVERSGTVNVEPNDGGFALKSFGAPASSNSGAFQIITGVAPGQTVDASVMLYSPAFDKLGGSGQAGIRIEFLNLFDGTIGTIFSDLPFNASSPADTWVPATLSGLVAPTGTVKVRVTCRLEWTPGNISGAVYWDDVQVSINSGANQVYNGDFETAGPAPGQSPVGIDDWTGFGDQEKSSDISEHGDFSLRLGIDSQFSGLFQNLGNLGPGDRILVSGYVWNPSSDPLINDTVAGLKLEWSASSNVPGPEENLAFDPNSPQNSWTAVSLNTTVPTDATIARIVCIYVADGGTTGEVHFDSVSAIRGSVSGNQLLNSSFENGPGGGVIDNWSTFDSNPTSIADKSCFAVPADDGACTAITSGTAVAGVFQEITVTPGETLDVTAMVYTPSSNPLGGTGVAGIKIEWAVGGIPGVIDIGGATNTVDSSDATDTWIPVFIDYTLAPDEAAIGRVVWIMSSGGELSGAAYADSCEAVVMNDYDGSDVDGDDDEDMHDVFWFQQVYTGAGAGSLPFNGITFDSDEDLDVDATDLQYFVDRLTGP